MAVWSRRSLIFKKTLVFAANDIRLGTMDIRGKKQKVKNFIKKIPGVKQLWHWHVVCKLSKMNPEEVFTEIYRKNGWGDSESLSGTGSNLAQTGSLKFELPRLFKELGIKTVLDIPCGDYYWMNQVDLGDVKYAGADIVKELVAKNKERYENDNINFCQLNLIADNLPKVDLVFCRDCLVHFSNEDVVKALKNISRSQSTFLLTTTFTRREKNKDIKTGEWRPLNLCQVPFNLPEPLKIIYEGCTEKAGDDSYSDKALGLWRIEDLINNLTE